MDSDAVASAFALADGATFLLKVRTALSRISQHEKTLIQQWHELEAR